MTTSLEEHVARADEEVATRLAAYIDAWWSSSDDDADTPTQRALSVITSIRESERAACEEIARGLQRKPFYVNGAVTAEQIADAIAARKGKGEGK